MAGLLNESINQFSGNSDNGDLNRIMHNPMFIDLQATLMSDMNTESVPYGLQNYMPPITTHSFYHGHNDLQHSSGYYSKSVESSQEFYHSPASVTHESVQQSTESNYIELNNNDYSKYDYNHLQPLPTTEANESIADQQHERAVSPAPMESVVHETGFASPVQTQETLSSELGHSHHLPDEGTSRQVESNADIPVTHIEPMAIEITPTTIGISAAALSPLQPLNEIVSITPNPLNEIVSITPNPLNEIVSITPNPLNEIVTSTPNPECSQPNEYDAVPAATALNSGAESYGMVLHKDDTKSFIMPNIYPTTSLEQHFNEQLQSSPVKEEGFDLLVEDATLQAEFRQMAPLCNEKVSQLETFYNTKCAEIMTQRSDAVAGLHGRGLDAEQLEMETNQLNFYYNKQQEHLVVRISQSLQLFKESLPIEQTPPVPAGGAKKPSKSRLLNSKAVAVMNKWYQDHIEYPYPTDEQKQTLAEEGDITLSQAASFGKCFLTDYQPETFVHMCQMLRVLNAIRDSNLGIPLTYSQLKHLSLTVLIDRLVLRRQYCLAIEICKYLKLPEAEGASRILAHWACYKVQQNGIDDESVARAIASKLGDTPGVSYSEIANKAIECGRVQLAVRLLDYEPRAVEQVPLLMKMKKNREALTKAIESGDTDLVFTVILQLKESLGLGEFLMVIRSYPTAYALYLQYCREQNRKLLQDIFEQEDQFIEEANCRVWESYHEERLEARLSCLSAAQDAYSKGRNDWAAKQTEEQIKLMKIQRKLESDFNRPYIDLSLHATIYRLIQENNHKWAEQLRKDFRVPDKRFWWLKIEAVAEAGDWAELDKFSKSKKSPIGYEPFVEVCMKYQRLPEAEKYIQRVQIEHKAKCLVKMGKFDEAIETAFQAKDADGLNLVIQKAGNNKEIVDKASRLKAQLGAR